MKRLLFFVSIGFVFLMNVNAQEVKDSKGQINYSYWEGKLMAPGMPIRVILKTFNKEDGSLSALLDVIDQNAKDIPVTSIVFTNDSLNFSIATMASTYKGKYIKDSLIVRGSMKQGLFDMTLDLTKVDKPSAINRPQTPKEPFPYNSEEVVFENKIEKFNLAGTLTIPKGNGKYPAVILVTGSGPQDRDETLLMHKPFAVLADYLTRNGIAVLRYDDRGVGLSKGSFAKATSMDFAQDALAAVEFLKTRKEIDSKKIGIAGHSEGGLIAPMCAATSSDVAFIVLLAGPGISGKEILLMQTQLILKAEGSTQKELENADKLNKRIYDVIENEADSLTTFNKLRALFDEDVKNLSAEEKNKPEYSEQAFSRKVSILLNPWFRFFVKYDPRPILEQLTIPVLAINGEKDLQVPPKENLKAIDDALKTANNKNYKIVELPNLNHLFQPTSTGKPSEYGQIETTFSEDALKIIGDWIKQTTK